ncbi:MAG TPA: saccharopine dehydrogenase NADP-binding domain-containing protein [Acidimicrobiales bacterium]|nr:saccharopine dehydrogenase NADP-binding domain-containing protein [Acidimicrobiales bacterium]
MTWMVYGAYGYTGRLVAALAAERGEQPVLAGRDEERLARLGELLELEHVCFDLSDQAAARRALESVDAVAHCAGPFSATARPMVDACLATGTHYLDITGEIDVFEDLLARDEEAKAAGVALLPGSGFDVVPSDCLAAMLAHELPGATSLALAIRMSGGPSPGTAKTMVESIGLASRARVGGVIGRVPPQRRRRRVPFITGASPAIAIAWGDVSTAYHSTGIGDITVYAALPRGAAPLAGLLGLAGPVARTRTMQGPLRLLAGRMRGPTAQTRSKSLGEVWGEAMAPDGTRTCGSVTTGNGYDLTSDSVVRIATLLAAGKVEPGASTPSSALGADFVRQLDGVAVQRL